MNPCFVAVAANIDSVEPQEEDGDLGVGERMDIDQLTGVTGEVTTGFELNIAGTG